MKNCLLRKTVSNGLPSQLMEVRNHLEKADTSIFLKTIFLYVIRLLFPYQRYTNTRIGNDNSNINRHLKNMYKSTFLAVLSIAAPIYSSFGQSSFSSNPDSVV